MLEQTELSMTILRFRTECRQRVIEGFTFVRFFLILIEEKVVLDRLVVSEEGIRQLALAT